MPDAAPTIPADLPDPSKYAPKGLPIEPMLLLRRKGLSYQQIADIVKCTKANVIERIHNTEPYIDNIDAIKKAKSDLLHIKQSQILNSLTLEDIKESSAYQKVGMFGILYDKTRLEDDRSTANLDVNSRITTYKRNEDELNKLNSMIAELEGDAIE